MPSRRRTATTRPSLLQYHLHIPGPDPLTAPDNMDRAKMYGDSFEGTPAVFFNGRFTVEAGGSREKAENSFRKCSDVVEKVMKTPRVKAKVTANAVRKGDAITIKTEVKDAADVGQASAACRPDGGLDPLQGVQRRPLPSQRRPGDAGADARASRSTRRASKRS